MAAPPDVSVVVPTRNRRRLLQAALRSVLRQRSVDLEVIVVDEASADGTGEMIAGLGDRRVRVLRHASPRGVAAARNHGLEDARGAWVGFLDDDDVWAPEKLARQLTAAHGAGRDWAYTGCVNITVDGTIVHGRPPLSPDEVMAAIPRYNAIPAGGSNVVARRALLASAGPFDTRLRNTEDWEMWIRLAEHGPPACASSPLIAYRVHTSNASLDTREIERGARLIESLHGTTVDWGRLHRWMAESCLRRGQRAAALTEFARAAVHGQAAGVLSDLRAIVTRRLIGGGAPPLANGSAPAWIAEAASWLRELESCAS